MSCGHARTYAHDVLHWTHEYPTLAGHRAHVVATGPRAGPPVVLVPSMFLMARTYRDTMRALAGRGEFRAIAIEMPGSGESSPLREPWDFARYADWLVRLLEQMGLSRVPLIGHSNSGAVALHAGASGSPAVGSIILADPIGGSGCGSMWKILPSRAFDVIFEPHFSIAAWPDAVFNLVHHGRSFWQQLRLARTNLLDVARRVTALPALVLVGQRDYTMPVRCARSLATAIPDARLHVSSTGSHDWLVSHADEFAVVVRDFLASRTTRPPDRMPAPGCSRYAFAPPRGDGSPA